ncbi:MAG: SnoaL-like domain [Solirubrobacterales bacterium]|nr:SnoaL-like domain [Solirubrobacterales bacterium]
MDEKRLNAEQIRKFFDAYNRGDLEATLDLLAPEFEFRPSGLFMDTERTYRGHEGWSEFWHTFSEAWESITVNVERIEDLGEQTLILGTFHGRGHGGGVEVTREAAWLTTLRDGLTVRTRTFANWAEALEAAGLEE